MIMIKNNLKLMLSNRNGWAFTVSAIGRYAKEGVMDGTFYNSGGLFASIEKQDRKSVV